MNRRKLIFAVVTMLAAFAGSVLVMTLTGGGGNSGKITAAVTPSAPLSSDNNTGPSGAGSTTKGTTGKTLTEPGQPTKPQFKFQLPTGVSDVTTSTQGTTQEIRFITGPYAARVRQQPATPSDNTLANLKNIYSNQGAERELTIAGHKGLLITNGSGNYVGQLFVTVEHGTLMYAQVIGKNSQTISADSVLAQLIGDATPAGG